MSKKQKPLQVKQCKVAPKARGLEPNPEQDVWGITDGKKWFWFAYTHKESAEKMMVGLQDEGRRSVNILHEKAFALSELKPDQIKN